MALCAAAQTDELHAAKRPNVILLMADDLGWGDVGFNGNTLIKTPNLDQMARDGVKFERFYAASAVSSPTRASVLTGRNPYRTGVFHANVGILRPEEVTIPELLKAEGYATGHFGKWHLGTMTDSERDANRGKVGNTKDFNTPSLHGYDVAFATESKVPTWDPMKRPIVESPEAAKKLGRGWVALKEGDKYEEYGTHYWDINNEKVTDNLDGDDSRVIMDRVLPFIDKSLDKRDNFCAVVWFHAPHLPCVAGPEYAAMYKGEKQDMQNFAGCITAMDEQIGRLRKFLQERGVEEDTMIWFCSDNGPEGGVGVTGGFKGRKRSLYEGGVRVPGILLWGGGVKRPMVSDFPCVTTDYLPTIAAAVGVDKSKMTNELDGINLLPMLQGKELVREKPIVTVLQDQISITRGSDKLYCLPAEGRYERYDLSADKFEKSGVAATVEDADYETMLEIFAHYKGSFDGDEYGTASVERMNQKWTSPMAMKSSAKASKAKKKAAK